MGVNGIYGLSGSGLDIESMVKVGMMGKQKQLDKLQQQTDLATWKKESMSSVYGDLSTYNYSTLTQYKLQSNMNAMSATSSDESIVKVTANGSASSMTHKVSVGGLSSNAYLITGNEGITRNNTSASSSIYLADNLFDNGKVEGSAGKIYSIEGKDYTAVAKSGSTTDYTIYSSNNNNRIKIRETISDNNVKYEQGDGSGNWNEVTGNNAAILKRIINGERLAYPSGGNKYNLQSTDSATTNFVFTAGDGRTDTYTFKNKDVSNPDTTSYSYTYQNANGEEQTLDISHDLSTLVNSEKFIIESGGDTSYSTESISIRKVVEGNSSPRYEIKNSDGNWVALDNDDSVNADEATIGGKSYAFSGEGNTTGYSYTKYSLKAEDGSTAALRRLVSGDQVSYEKQDGEGNWVSLSDGDKVSATEISIGGKTYNDITVEETKVNRSYTEYSLKSGDDTAAIRRIVEGDQTRYEKQDGEGNWVALSGDDTVSATELKIDGKTYNEAIIGETKQDSGISYTEYTYASSVEETSPVSRQVAGNDTVAISFTVEDGTEDYSGMTQEEIAEAKKKYTISYTYGELTQSGKTYNDLVSDINALGKNIKASYDAASDTFSLYNKESGQNNQIKLTMNTEFAATLFNNLGLKQSNGSSLSDIGAFETGGANTTAGTSGSITIDGKTYDNVENNRITVDGVTYNLQDVPETKKTVNVVISQNTDAIIDKVKSFVEDYNKLLDGLYEKYSETKYSDYKPLTDSQRDKMTDKQIEKWEEKAKSGLLYHDRTIGSIIDKIRTALATPVDGLDSKYNSAYSIGIYTSKTNGHISLDEDRLKKALAEDPEAAYNVFGTLPNEDKLKAQITNSDGTYDKSRLSQMMYDGMGVAQRLGDVMGQAMKNVKTEAGESADFSDDSNLGKKIMEFQQKMSDFKTLMSAFETRLFKKYDAMESLLATLGAQMNYITGGQ